MPHPPVAPAHRSRWLAGWRRLWLIVAIAAALPAAYYASESLRETRLALHARLIVANELWLTDPAYAGSPRDWTRFAAWLLSSRQLLERARSRDPARGDVIEEEFQRDAFLAYGGVVATYLAGWGAPLGIAFALGWLRERRRRN